jgi:hypothetical protein
VDEVFSLKDRQKSLDLIDHYDRFWMQMKSGCQGISGKKTRNAMTMFDQLFEVDISDPEIEEIIEDSDDAIAEVLGE